MINYLKYRLNLQNVLLCQGDIRNLIIQEGLKVVNDALKINQKYVKALDTRLMEFHKCVEDVHISNVGGSFQRLDVSIRLNSTCLMLKSTIRYCLAFTRIRCLFLSPFYTITNLIYWSSYPLNLYFMQIVTIQMKLNELVKSEDKVTKDMSLRMRVNFISIGLILHLVIFLTQKKNEILNILLLQTLPKSC